MQNLGALRLRFGYGLALACHWRSIQEKLRLWREDRGNRQAADPITKSR